MNKKDLVNLIASEGNTSKTTAAKMVESVISGITSALRKGDDVTLSGFGTFSTYKRQARNGRNPRTGAMIKIPSCRTAKLTPGVDLRKALNRK
jgi:DNA-binding protein HU-beta